MTCVSAPPPLLPLRACLAVISLLDCPRFS
jgi:hypothetical protein